MGGPNSDAVSIGWASNWQYTQLTPTDIEGWRSTMSLPRQNFLANVTRTGMRMYSAPYGLDAVRGSQLASNSSLSNGTLFADYSSVSSNAVYLEVNVTGINSTTISSSATLNFTFFSPGSGESLRGGYFFGGESVNLTIHSLRLTRSQETTPSSLTAAQHPASKTSSSPTNSPPPTHSAPRRHGP